MMQVLAAAADDVEECGICGEAGEVALDPDEEPSGALLLRFTLLLRMRFEDRALLATRALARLSNPFPATRSAASYLQHLKRVHVESHPALVCSLRAGYAVVCGRQAA